MKIDVKKPSPPGVQVRQQSSSVGGGGGAGAGGILRGKDIFKRTQSLRNSFKRFTWHGFSQQNKRTTSISLARGLSKSHESLSDIKSFHGKDLVYLNAGASDEGILVDDDDPFLDSGTCIGDDPNFDVCVAEKAPSLFRRRNGQLTRSNRVFVWFTRLLGKVQSETAWQETGTTFIQSVTKLLERLLDYR